MVETQTVAEEQVIAALASSSRWRVVSSVTAQLLGKDRSQVTMAEVRVVHRVLRDLESAGRVKRQGKRGTSTMLFQLAP